MDDSGAERTAIIVIRAWLEASQSRPLRARMTARLDAQADMRQNTDQTAVAASVEGAVDQLERWLREFVEGPAGPESR
jgi:hypothetical protein